MITENISFQQLEVRAQALTTNKAARNTLRLARAILQGRFNYGRYLGGGSWHGMALTTGPLFCSYGLIGFTVDGSPTADLLSFYFDWEKQSFSISWA